MGKASFKTLEADSCGSERREFVVGTDGQRGVQSNVFSLWDLIDYI